SFDTLGSFGVKLTVTFSDNGCSTSTIKKDDIVVQRFPTSINNGNLETQIYPTIINNVLHIESNHQIESILMVSVEGKTHLYKTTMALPITLNTSKLPKGVYMLIINTNNGDQVFKVIKQ
ncbi:MAG: T9SS type A sorting domain-containing protein, partial [Bacteroidia bacterium]